MLRRLRGANRATFTYLPFYPIDQPTGSRFCGTLMNLIRPL